MIVFVPMIDVSDSHWSGSDWDSSVVQSVDNVYVLEAFRRQDHRELAPVRVEHLESRRFENDIIVKIAILS